MPGTARACEVESDGMTLPPSGFLTIGATDLEYRMIGPAPDDAPTIVMLHEGLGSAALWGDFPDRLQAATGAGVFVYSRAGYGASTPVKLPRPLDYMHIEALEVLPKLLERIGFRRGLLLGHSDGASIAAIYAGGVQDHRVRGVALIAPHFIVEDISVTSIAEIKTAYETTDLKAKLARWHNDVDNAFYGWNGAWLDPKFRDWDISEYLAYIRVPVAILQGVDDQYGTIRQVEIAREECYCPVDVTEIPGAGHSPHREAPEATLDAIAEFANAFCATRARGPRSSDRGFCPHDELAIHRHGNLPLPRWAYVPGETAEADADYETLAQAKLHLVPPRFRGYVPARHPALRYGLALNDRGYFWESQEMLEAVWAAAPQGGRERILLRACIQIASANLRLRMQKPHAAARLFGEALQELHALSARKATAAGDGFADGFPTAALVGTAQGQAGQAAAVQGRLGRNRRHRPNMKQNAYSGVPG